MKVIVNEKIKELKIHFFNEKFKTDKIIGRKNMHTYLLTWRDVSW